MAAYHRSVLAGVLPLALTFLAAADPTVAERIARGEAALSSLDYDVAAEELTTAAADERATDDERMRANLLAGIANVIVGRDGHARLSFRYVLLRAPDTRLAPDTPQKVVSYFELVRHEIAAERASAAPPAATPAATPAMSPLPTTPGSTTAQSRAAPVGLVEPVEPVEAVEPIEAPLMPWIVVGVGAVGAAAGAALLIVCEASLGQPPLLVEQKRELVLYGRIGAGVAAAGVLVAASGAALGVLE